MSTSTLGGGGEAVGGFAQPSGFQLAWVDATSIALKSRLGTRTHPIVNTAMMGALARMLGMPPMEAVALESSPPGRAINYD